MFGLQRKLRTFEKKHDPIHKSLDETADGEIQLEMQKPKSACSDDESIKAMTILSSESTETKSTPQVRAFNGQLIKFWKNNNNKKFPAVGYT